MKTQKIKSRIAELQKQRDDQIKDAAEQLNRTREILDAVNKKLESA